MTALNRQILDLILCEDRHMNAEEVFLLAKEKGIKVSIASVYRILSKLSEEGYLKQLTQQACSNLFDKNTKSHGHLVCQKCGKISDVDLQGFLEKLKEITKEEVFSYELTANYICPECRNNGGIKNGK